MERFDIMAYDAANVLRGEVKAIIKPTVPGEAEKVQISIQSGEEPDQEIRIVNTLTTAQGETVALKRGAALHVVIWPKPKATA
jgi:molybdopterin-binding protein